MSSTPGTEAEAAELRRLQTKANAPRGMTDADWARLHVLEKKLNPTRHAIRMESGARRLSGGSVRRGGW